MTECTKLHLILQAGGTCPPTPLATPIYLLASHTSFHFETPVTWLDFSFSPVIKMAATWQQFFFGGGGLIRFSEFPWNLVYTVGTMLSLAKRKWEKKDIFFSLKYFLGENNIFPLFPLFFLFLHLSLHCIFVPIWNHKCLSYIYILIF